MNTRERFHASMNFEPVDRPLFWEFGYWLPAMRRWYGEGLQRVHGFDESLDDDATISGEALGIDWRNPNRDHDVHQALGFDEYVHRIPINNLFCPVFETKTLDDQPDWYIIQDIDGVIVRISKQNGSRQYIDFPVKCRADYEKIREERLQPNLADRMAIPLDEARVEFKDRTYPVMYGGMQGFFNQPRRLMGFDRLMLAFCAEPDLVKQIINDTCDLLIALYDPALSAVSADYAMISEDMCYKSGCFVSPEMFREFMLPAYKRLTDFYRDHGIRTIVVDSDGDVMGLIPLLIEGGVTGLHPFEVIGRNDVVEVRRQWPRFQIWGGIGKKIVATTKEAIDRELERLIPPLMNTGGGFIPFIDHTVPPEVSWENFTYYRERLADMVTS